MEKENLSASKMIGKCPECGSTRLVKYCEDEDIVCMNCGFVTTLKTVEENSEQTCNSDLEKKLTAQTLKNLGKALPTVRIIRDRKKRRRELAVSDQQARIFERWQKLIKVSDATETRLALAFLEITGIAETLSLPKTVIEVATAMYKSIVEKSFVRGRSIRALSAATVYTACKRCGLARILDEIASASRINAIEIARNYRFIIKELNLSISPSTFLITSRPTRA